MVGSGDIEQRDLVTLVVGSVGGVVETGVIWEPYRLVDSSGGLVTSVTAFLHDLQASGRTTATQRSYALDCCAGSGSFGRSTCLGSGRLVARRGISAGGLH